jgi:hypothetical protein
MNVGAWLLAVLIIELVAILLVAYLSFSGFFHGMRILAKIGVWVMTTGLIVQIMRSLHYFEFGAYPIDTIFPLWVTKDIGASLIVFDLFLLSRKRR